MAEIASVFAQGDQSLRRNTAFTGREYRAVAIKAGIQGGNLATNTSDGVATAGTAWQLHKTPNQQVRGVRLAYSNFRLTATGEVTGANDITVRASIFYSGTYYPVFFGGKRSVTIEAGGEVLSDPSGIDIPANASFYTYTYVSVASAGMTWPVGRSAMSSLSEGNNYGAPGADITLTGGGTNANGYVYGPSAIVGIPTVATQRAMLIFGDSIAAGTGASETTSGDSLGCRGFVERALSNNLPWLSYSRASMQATQFAAAHSLSAGRIASFVDGVICEHSTNDIYANGSSYTLAQAQAGIIAAWRVWQDRGLPIWQTTCTPKTTSTDGWVTTANQTISSTALNAVRVAFNNWVRDGAPMSNYVAVATGTVGALRAGDAGHPLKGYFEIADIAETARDSGIWKANATTDGLHPNQAMHISMAAGITLASLA